MPLLKNISQNQKLELTKSPGGGILAITECGNAITIQYIDRITRILYGHSPGHHKILYHITVTLD